MAGSWEIRRICGGSLVQCHPAFSLDENFLLSAHGSDISVLSLSSSQTHNSFSIGTPESISALTISATDPDRLCVITTAGSLSLWYWKSGKRIGVGKPFETIQRVEFFEACHGDRVQKAVACLRRREDGIMQILTTVLDENDLSSQAKEVTILETSLPVTELRVSQSGMVVFALARRRLLVGRTTITPDANCVCEYDWREIVLPFEPTTLDIREYSKFLNRPRHESATRISNSVDLAVGNFDGSILVYGDIANTLWETDDAQQDCVPDSLVSQRLHWHREGPGSLRWSKDGQYLVSGGKEAVLVLWQLDSGRQSFLPHFPAPIGAVHISPSGRLYAILTSDNSLVVLSTSDWQQVAKFVGLQSGTEIPTGGGIEAIAKQNPGTSSSLLSTFHPQNPNHLMLVVPARRSVYSERLRRWNLSILQTFDLGTGTQVSRQALTRTNATTLRNGPEGSEIFTPDIHHLDISDDGSWMASVESWSSSLPSQDVEAPFLKTGIENRLDEVFLKFWLWDESKGSWKLITRLEGPHFQDGSTSNSVLSLASRPGVPGFATFGADDVIRYWVPDFESVKMKRISVTTGGPYSWKCRASVIVRSGNFTESDWQSKSASIAFSEDGSVLALCTQGHVYLVDTQSWSVRFERKEACWTKVFSIQFLDRHLILAASQSTFVWDVVDDVLIDLLTAGHFSGVKPHFSEHETILFAVNRKSNSYALAVKSTSHRKGSKRSKRSGHGGTYKFNIYVNDLTSKITLLQSTIDYYPVSLLSDPHSGDYIVFDSASNCYRISSETTSPHKHMAAFATSDYGLRNLNDLFGESSSHRPHGTSTEYLRDRAHRDLSERSTELLTTSCLALPSVNALFQHAVRSIPET